MQEPDSGAVTDSVRREMAFAPDNLGIPKEKTAVKMAETVSYFGMQSFFDKRINELSGGQKQLLNLASVMMTDPEILLLDEPVSQLDPVAASAFISAVVRLNRENGVTVLITAHKTDDIMPYADRVIIMEKGRIGTDCVPERLFEAAEKDESVTRFMPSFARIIYDLGIKKYPVTAGEAAQLLSDAVGEPGITKTEHNLFVKNDIAVKVKGLTYKYGKHEKEILSDLDADIPAGCVYAVFGGNGSGKSTLLKLISGIIKSPFGKISIRKGAKTSYLPQNVRLLFTRKTVGEELGGRSDTAELCVLTGLLERHPFDLSGGEQQRLALAMVLSSDPDIILMDEPTKGMDSVFREQFVKIVSELKNRGITIILVTHDTEFCAACADMCAVLFDGRLHGESSAQDFLCTNAFYTTPSRKISKHIFENCITEKDVTQLCGINIKKPR